MDVTNIVAANVRSVREDKRLTLEAAAEITGVSRSMLAQIEKGDVNPTISVLWKIANGFKVSFTSLIESRSEEALVIKSGEIQPITEDGGRYINYPAFPFDEKKLFETYRIVIKPGGKLSAAPPVNMKGSEEYLTIFSGELELCIEDRSYSLSRGDSIRFKADVPHNYENKGDTDTELSMLICYRGE